MAGTALGETNEQASMWRTPASSSASMSRTRSSTGRGSWDCSPSRGPTSRMSTLSTDLDGRDAVAAVAERAVLGAGQLEAGHELVAQVLGRNHGVDDELGRQAQQVDVLFVLGPPLGHEPLPLRRIAHLRDPVGEDGVDGGLG